MPSIVVPVEPPANERPFSAKFWMVSTMPLKPIVLTPAPMIRPSPPAPAPEPSSVIAVVVPENWKLVPETASVGKVERA